MRYWHLFPSAAIAAAFLTACVGGGNLTPQPQTPPGAANDSQHRLATPASGGREFVYTANAGSSNVSAYKVNARSGVLTAVHGSPFAAGSGTTAVGVDPAAAFLYAVNQNYPNPQGSISGYAINTRSGALTQVPGSPFGGTGESPYQIAFTSDGAYVYVPNIFSNNVSGYSIANNGSLSTLSGSPFGSCCQPEGVAVAGNSFVYVTNTETDSVSGATIGASGNLSQTSGSPYGAGTTPEFPAVDPVAGYIYVPNQNSNNVSVYSIGGSSGALTAISGSPFTAGTNPRSAAFMPNGKFVYITNTGSNSISAYSVNPLTGAPTQISGSPFSAGTTPVQVAVDPRGKFLYACNAGSNNISAYKINANTGALTPVAGSPFSSGSGPAGIAVAQEH